MPCTVTARPINEPKDAEGLLLVVFRDRESPAWELPADRAMPPDEAASIVNQLENELRATRDDLQSTIEELESSNEELKASNEEVMSMNEELQSTNEELETSKEEMQSLNEELATVNNQLQDKVEDLDSANADLTNLMAATEIATIILDTDLGIRRFTPPTAKLLNLLATDVGRPISDLSPRFTDDDLLGDAERVLETLSPNEKVIGTDDDHWYLRRILPYRASDNRIGGVVITLFDVTARHKAEAQIRALNAELEQRVAERTSELEASGQRIRAVLDTTVDAIITIDTRGSIETFNAAAETMFGYKAGEMIGQNISVLMAPPYREHHDEYLRRYMTTREPRLIGRIREFKARRKDGSEFPIQLAVSEIEDLGLFTGIIRDVTVQRALQEEIVRVATREQRRIGQELHDSTQQELTGLGLLARNLADALTAPEQAAQRDLAARIASGISDTHRHVQRLAKGLVPVPVSADGLMLALADLAERTQKEHGIQCRFVCPSSVRIKDDHTAMHMFRIAQEAVANAIKHAALRTITIHLRRSNQSSALEIKDDGTGIGERASESEGLGLRIMEHRCGLIGGTFFLENRTSGGTVVKCELPADWTESKA